MKNEKYFFEEEKLISVLSESTGSRGLTEKPAENG